MLSLSHLLEQRVVNAGKQTPDSQYIFAVTVLLACHVDDALGESLERDVTLQQRRAAKPGSAQVMA
jgi:hypothetical protein